MDSDTPTAPVTLSAPENEPPTQLPDSIAPGAITAPQIPAAAGAVVEPEERSFPQPANFTHCAVCGDGLPSDEHRSQRYAGASMHLCSECECVEKIHLVFVAIVGGGGFTFRGGASAKTGSRFSQRGIAFVGTHTRQLAAREGKRAESLSQTESSTQPWHAPVWPHCGLISFAMR
jgi:hypothetical protein